MNIVVLSRSSAIYSTNRIVEAGIRKGHRMMVLDHLHCDLVIEDAKPKVYYRGRLIENIDAVIPRIGASVTYYGAAVIRHFELMDVFVSLTSAALIRSRDKLMSLQLLTRYGLDMPKTVFTNFSSNIHEIIEEVGGTPLILKLLEGTQGLGVVLAETPSAAESVLEAFNGLKARVIVQEFIKEAKGADIRAFVVDGKIVGSMRRQAKEGEFRSNLHRGGTAEVIELTKKEHETAIKATRALGLNIAGVDMLQSSRGPLLLEVNSSPGLEGIEGATGVDIAGRIIDYVERETLRRRKRKSR